jgi:hypothetical protein
LILVLEELVTLCKAILTGLLSLTLMLSRPERF